MGERPTVGLYGKLPCKGDFVLRRVSREFVDPWDSWLQECLTQSRQQLQAHWLDAYLFSPVWRFALAGGLCGGGAYAGVLLPSVDLVGRYFPLTLVARWESTLSPLLLAANQDGWFDLVQALALEALDAPALDFEDFDRRVSELSCPSEVAVQSPSSVERALDPVSLWWTDGSQDVDPCLLCMRGLPNPGGFATMLSGKAALQKESPCS